MQWELTLGEVRSSLLQKGLRNLLKDVYAELYRGLRRILGVYTVALWLMQSTALSLLSNVLDVFVLVVEVRMTSSSKCNYGNTHDR